ncbi:MAG: hypothetical protein AMQ22_00332 [Candidatus Methanofastidiosum methylothiophilum]|uniref:Transglutaminase-like domain-containing protein n=1 Tax=Candidatus Methanofastidiosum methylothiophilum TaxID=1705564 RepID=A0A150J8B4_9EURY|nr:MAG: hypothetical protein AMQ22_00332 [Candidatus Methanofastidiosum methylthiophilus]
MVIENTQKRKTPKKWFIIPVIFIAIFILVDNVFFTEYYSSGPPLPPILDQNATDIQHNEYTEKIQDLENLLSASEEKNEQLLIYQKLFINSQKRSSLILQRYSERIERNIVEDQRNMGKFITPNSKGIQQINQEIPQGNYLLNSYNYIIENYYYYYDPFTRTSEGTQEWTNIKAYDLKNDKWIEVKLRDSVTLQNFPDIIFYPDETIDFGGGDCEDFAILYSSMAITKGYSSYVYIVDIDKDGMNLLHAISIVNDNILIDIPSKLYIEGKGEDDLFNKYIKAIKAQKVTIVNKFDNEEYSNIKKTYG